MRVLLCHGNDVVREREVVRSEAKRRRKRATSVDRWYDRFDDMIDVDCTLCIDCAYFTAAAATATVPPPPPPLPPTCS